MIHEGRTGEVCFEGTSHASPGRNLVIDEFELFSETETTKMDHDDVLNLDVSDAALGIDSLGGGHHPGDSQPAPSDQSYPIDKRNLP